MNEQLKKIFLTGLGATLASKEKADQLFGNLSHNGSAAADEAKAYLSKLSDKGQTKTDQWQSDMKKDIRESIADLGFVTSEEYQKLAERVQILEQKLAESEKKGSTDDTESPKQ